MADEPTGEQPWSRPPSVNPQAGPIHPPPPAGYRSPGDRVQLKKRSTWPWVLGGVLGVAILVGGCVALRAAVGESLHRGVAVKAADPSTAAANSGPDFPGKRQGDTAAMADEGVTVDGVTTTTSLLFDRGQNSSLYLCTTATIHNDSTESLGVSTSDWTLQDPSGSVRDSSATGSTNMLDSGDVAAGGGTVEGDVCFDNPHGNAFGTFVVLFDPPFSDSSDRVAWINQR